MRLSRRGFLKLVGASAAALGLTSLELVKLSEVLTKETSGLKVIWVHGQNCSGCTTSFLGIEWDGYLEGIPAEISRYMGVEDPVLEDSGLEPDPSGDSLTTIDDVLLDIIDLKYLSTIMATAGEGAYDILKDHMANWDTIDASPNKRILIVEGSIPTLHNDYCTIASDKDGSDELYIGDVVDSLAAKATDIIALGNCACFGGIPGARCERRSTTTQTKNETDAISVQSHLGGGYSVVNLPGCPIHPDWLMGTLIMNLLGTLQDDLDTYNRPSFYYGSTLHGGRCLRYQAYCDGQFAEQPGQSPSEGGRVYTMGMPSAANDLSKLGQPYDIPLCLNALGCRGYSTGGDCAFGGPAKDLSTPVHGRGWNVRGRTNGEPTVGNSCINNGYPCQGCTEKGYPDKFSPFFNY